MKGFRLVYVFGLLVLMLLVLVGLMGAQEPESPAAERAAGSLGSAFTYQGQLSDGSDPITDECTMAFRL
jgi:hypothetical protein